MEKELLLKRLEELGYPLQEIDIPIDENEILAEVIKTQEPRLWEGFPILLARLLDTNKIDYSKITDHFDKNEYNIHFRFLLAVSFALFHFLGLNYKPPKDFTDSGSVDKNKIVDYQSNFKNSKDISDSKMRLSPSRLINTFKIYSTQSGWNVKDYVALTDDFDLEYALSQIFSQKQKELIFKRLRGEKMTKTEQEYSSRSVKACYKTYTQVIRDTLFTSQPFQNEPAFLLRK